MRKSLESLVVTGLGSLILSICAIVIGCATATKVESIPITSNKEEEKVFNLSGRWEYPTQQGGSIVEIIQDGYEIKGYYRSFSNDFPVPRCAKDAIWFEGRIKENKVLGKRYLCGGGTETLYMEISEGGDLLSLAVKRFMSGERGSLTLRRIK